MSRRTALGVGLGVVTLAGASHLVGVDDDALRALGVSPHPEPDPADARLVRRALEEQEELTLALMSLIDAQPSLAKTAPTVVTAAQSQLKQLGGSLSGLSVGEKDLETTARAFAAAARRRERDAMAASDVALARVLASLSAGQAQIARTLGRSA